METATTSSTSRKLHDACPLNTNLLKAAFGQLFLRVTVKSTKAGGNPAVSRNAASLNIYNAQKIHGNFFNILLHSSNCCFSAKCVLLCKQVKEYRLELLHIFCYFSYGIKN